jgi:nitrogen fixation/metabolism regulation signal transduction histidine kinase
MGIGPIPWTAMTEYARYLNLDRDVTEAFVDIMREMDNAYVEYQTAEQKRLSELSKAKPPNKGTP